MMSPRRVEVESVALSSSRMPMKVELAANRMQCKEVSLNQRKESLLKERAELLAMQVSLLAQEQASLLAQQRAYAHTRFFVTVWLRQFRQHSCLLQDWRFTHKLKVTLQTVARNRTKVLAVIMTMIVLPRAQDLQGVPKSCQTATLLAQL